MCSYAEKNNNMEFWPTCLGEALISAYRRMGLDGLWKPDLRGRIEVGIGAVAGGHQTKEQVQLFFASECAVYAVLLCILANSRCVFVLRGY